MKDKDGYKLGDYICTTIYSYKGRIIRKYHSFRDTHYTDEWFNQLTPRLPESVKSESWYSVLVEGGGSILTPESNILKIIEPFDLDNVWESYYFNV